MNTIAAASNRIAMNGTSFLISLSVLRGLLQARINRFHEHVGGPRAAVCPVPGVVVGGDSRRLDLFESGAALEHGSDSVPHDNNHVSIFHPFMFIGQITMAWNDQRATLSFVLENGPIKDVIERFDLALYGSPVFDVDERELSGIEDIARDDHVGLAKVKDAVAVGDRIRLMKNFDGVPVVVLAPAIVEKSICGQAWAGEFRLHHAGLDILLGHDSRPRAPISDWFRE